MRHPFSVAEALLWPTALCIAFGLVGVLDDTRVAEIVLFPGIVLLKVTNPEFVYGKVDLTSRRELCLVLLLFSGNIGILSGALLAARRALARQAAHRDKERTSKAPDAERVLLWTIAIAGASSFLLPLVPGYGTWLSQEIFLDAWLLVAGVTDGRFADSNGEYVLCVELVLNLSCFLVVAVPVNALLRPWPCVQKRMGFAWLGFYLAILYLLFPATDGP